jgi:hypothetical protein
MVRNLYAVWIRINETLPWVELENEYQTRAQARKEAKNVLSRAKIKVVTKQKSTKRVRVLATMK